MIYKFAQHYGARAGDTHFLAAAPNRFTASQSQARPSTAEMAEMTQRAVVVVKLLEDLRRIAEFEASNPPEPKYEDVNRPMQLDAQGSVRIPKRPWEDVEQEDQSGLAAVQGYSQVVRIPSTVIRSEDHLLECHGQPTAFISSATNKRQSMAEKDMAIIRSKRATNAGALNAGQPKGKYRKRSVSNPLTKHASHVRPPIIVLFPFVAFMIIFIYLHLHPAVHTARNAAWKMPLVHDPRDTRVEAWARWCADAVQCMWSP